MGQIKHILPLAFLCFLFSSNARGQSVSDSLEQRILSAQAEGRVIDNLNNSFLSHPTGEFLLAPANRDLKFCILIYNIDILPDKAVFSAGMAFRDPKSNQLVAFRADNIAFSKATGLTGPVKLYLISDIFIPLGRAAEIVIETGMKETYAVFECRGLTEFGIRGHVDFDAEFILPVDSRGEIKPGEKMNSDFSLKAKSWTDMVVQITMQPFQVKGLNNYVFNISNAIMDLSEVMNAAQMKFPEVYNTVEILGANISVWEGFYLQKGSITFPDYFQNNLHQRVKVGVSDLLIDEFGFSGNIFGSNLLDFEKGRIANWNFSIENVEISLVMNEIVGGQLSGDLGLPILPDTSKLHYSAYIGANDNYGMVVSLRNNLTIPAFKVSEMRLTSNSYVDMQIEEGRLTLVAELNGEFSIENKGGSTSGGPKFRFPSVTFQGFRMANTEPAIDIQYLGLKNSSESSLFSGYPLNIQEIYLQKSNKEKRIGIRFGLNLMEKIAVKAGVSIVADDANDKLQFRKLEIPEINVKSVTSCFTLEGRINFIKEDPLYGNGFSGNIKFTIDKPKLGADASILFGNINNHRYWYFDASVMWGRPGLPFFPGSEINGFIGGAFSGMRETNVNDHTGNSGYGITATGKQYLPDVSSGLGLKAGVYLRSTGGSDNSAPFLAKLALELQFNNKNGLNRIAFYGTVDIMTQSNKMEKEDLQQSTAALPGLNAWNSYKSAYIPQGKIGGPMSIEFDFMNKSYQANFAVYLQGIAGNKIAGAGAKGLAGECSVYFGQDKWYFWIGTPQQPISLRMEMGLAGSALVYAYFMAGKEVKQAASLPHEITNILGDRNSGELRKLNEMAEGNAFAFGSRLNLQIGSSGGERNVSIYASLKAIIGFDINVASYGKNIFCEGHSGPPGINGWYANGQLFAFLQGTVGASYKVAGRTGQLDLMTLTCASELYCQGPNPFYSKGSSSIQVNIAGVINKRMDLKFEIGEQCQLRKTRFSDTFIILETTPGNGENNISTMATLKTRFSVAIGQPFKDVEGRQNVFRLKTYEVTENGYSIPGNISWNEVRNELVFTPQNLLPARSKVKVRIVVEAAYSKSDYEVRNADGSNVTLTQDDNANYIIAVNQMKTKNLTVMDFGRGRKIYRNDHIETIVLNGRKVEEIKESVFYTGANPEYIPDFNIALAYPVRSQLNYYRKMSDNGFLELRNGQDYLLKVANTKVMALFIDANGTVIGESKVEFKGRKLQYLIPNHLLLSDAVYSLVIKRRNINASSEIGRTNNRTASSNADNNISSIVSNASSLGSKANAGANNYLKDLVLLNYSFAVSRYVSLEDKLKEMDPGGASVTSAEVAEFKIVNRKNEYFDCSEVNGSKDLKPLLQTELLLGRTVWFVNAAKNIYTIFKSADAAIVREIELRRDTSPCGFIPVRAAVLYQDEVEKMLLVPAKSGQEIKKPVGMNKDISIENHAFEIISNDLVDIKEGLIKYVSSNKTINSKELNEYLRLVNSAYNSEAADHKISESLNKIIPDHSDFTVSSLVGSGQLFNFQGNTLIPPSDKVSNKEWIVKISKIKLHPFYVNSVYPVSISYILPGALRPSASGILNMNIK